MRPVALQRARQERDTVRRTAGEARRLGRARLAPVTEPAPFSLHERRADALGAEQTEDRPDLGVDLTIRPQDTVLLAALDVDRRVGVERAGKGVNGSWMTGGVTLAAASKVTRSDRMG